MFIQLLTESAFWGGLEQNKRNILVNNLFNIFCNEKDIAFYYLLQTWYWSYCKNPDFFKVGSFEILFHVIQLFVAVVTQVL